jgi:hypothetical protein
MPAITVALTVAFSARLTVGFMNSPVFVKVKASAGKGHDLASSDRRNVPRGKRPFVGARPSLRTIFPVKNVFGYCRYSDSDS